MPLLLLLLFCSTLLHQALGKPADVSSVSEEQQKEIIEKINQIRRAVTPTASNMLEMKWSNDAAESAKLWAQECKLKASPVKKRIVNGMFCSETRLQSTFVAPWSEVIDAWHAKKSNFKYGVGPLDSNKAVYSYILLIWYNTHEIGCAVARCEGNKYPFFYVCHTCPAGNLGHMIATPYNEGLPCEDCPEFCEDKLCTNACNFMDKTKDCREALNMFGCNNKWMGKKCEATCKCTNHII